MTAPMYTNLYQHRLFIASSLHYMRPEVTGVIRVVIYAFHGDPVADLKDKKNT